MHVITVIANPARWRSRLALYDRFEQHMLGSGVELTTVYPGEVDTGLHDHEPHRMPDWYDPQNKKPAADCAVAIVRGIEADAREVFFPREVRALRVAHGLSPRLADTMLRRLRGATSAPRRD